MTRCPAKYDLYEKFKEAGDDNWCEIPVCKETMAQMDRYLEMVKRFDADGIPRNRTIVALSERAARPIISIKNHEKKELAIRHIESLLMRKTPKGAWYHEDIKGPEVIRILTKIGIYATSESGDNPPDRWDEIDPEWRTHCPEAVKQIEGYLSFIHQLETMIADPNRRVPGRELIMAMVPEGAARPILAIKDRPAMDIAIGKIAEFIRTGDIGGRYKSFMNTTDAQEIVAEAYGRPTPTARRREINRKENRAIRRAVLLRDQLTCQYCGREGTDFDPDGNPWHTDHETSRVNGGLSDISNYKLSCDSCNLKKGKKDQDWIGSRGVN